MSGRVTFVGAGPGAADLITVRGARVLAEADVVVWAQSLVSEEVLHDVRPDARVLDSTTLSLEDLMPVYEEAARSDQHVARVHSGDPSLWGAVHEQIARCRELGLAIDVVPGVPSFAATAAAVQRELTIPEVAQSVILTRLEGGKTPMPPRERIAAFAAHGTTMAIHLSAARSTVLAAELSAGGYPDDTPVVVAYQVSWPDELIVECTLATLVDTVRASKLWKHTMFLVGPALGASRAPGEVRSHLYHPGHFHGYRRAEPQARAALRARREDAARTRAGDAGD